MNIVAIINLGNDETNAPPGEKMKVFIAIDESPCSEMAVQSILKHLGFTDSAMA